MRACVRRAFCVCLFVRVLVHYRVHGPDGWKNALEPKQQEAAMAARRLATEWCACMGDAHGSRLTVATIDTLKRILVDYLMGIPNGSAATNAQDQDTFGRLKGGRGELW